MRDDFDGSIGRAHRVELVYRMLLNTRPWRDDRVIRALAMIEAAWIDSHIRQIQDRRR